jgi:hypothetical protein
MSREVKRVVYLVDAVAQNDVLDYGVQITGLPFLVSEVRIEARFSSIDADAYELYLTTDLPELSGKIVGTLSADDNQLFTSDFVHSYIQPVRINGGFNVNARLISTEAIATCTGASGGTFHLRLEFSGIV